VKPVSLSLTSAKINLVSFSVWINGPNVTQVAHTDWGAPLLTLCLSELK
jgi:hypothetical protein